MQAELSAERKDLSDLRNQLKAVVKSGARREEALRDELAASRDAIDDLRAEIESLREEIAVMGPPEVPAHDDEALARLAEEVHSLRKRLPFQSRRPTAAPASGFERDQVQEVADAVVAAILDHINIQPQ
jgi:chromosome segregation ATPase